MKKTIVSIIVIGLLLTTSIVTVSAIPEDLKHASTDDETSFKIMPYKLYTNHQMEFELDPGELLLQGDDDVEVLWLNSDDVDGKIPIFSSYINDDNIPDILVSHSALNGSNGELIWNTEAGEVCGAGDINNDDKDEIFTRVEGVYSEDYSMLYCLNGTNGEIIWEFNISCTLIYPIALGNLLGDETNEVIVPTGDWVYRNNQYVYCLNGSTGEVIWKKHTINRAICAEIADVNADSNNEVLVSNWEKRLYCLNGNGNVIWEIYNIDNADYRTICIGDLNEDPYKEIVIESKYGIRCVSGNNGNTLWTWYQEWDDGYKGSFQSIIIADMIPSILGNEVIAGGVCGVYCLYGGNNPPSGGREIWHAGRANGILTDIVMSSAVGDFDKDGLLDVAALTTWNYNVYAINGQYGSRLWKYAGCGTNCLHAIACTDLTGDGYPEVIAKDNSYVCALLNNFPSENLAPNMPTIDGPTSGYIQIPYDYTALGTDPDGDILYYYFDWGDGTGSISKSGNSGESVIVSHIWKVKGNYIVKAKAIDEHGAESNWSEPLLVTIENDQPNPPTINGPTNGKTGTEYNYTFVSIDPDGDDIANYTIDWDDNSDVEVAEGPFGSGEIITVSHTWDEQGTYIISAKATDIYGAEGDWGTLEVTMPRNRAVNHPFLNSLQNHPNMFPLLRQILGL